MAADDRGRAPDMKMHQRRAAAAWSERQKWSSVLADCYDWCMPWRRGGDGRTGASTMHLFDPTAVVSTMSGAGKLQQALFPPGQPFFRLRPGPVSQMIAAAASDDAQARDAAALFTRQLDALAQQVAPFFGTGEWDTAAAELCLDLYAGTGVMLILPGDRKRPVRFLALPIEEVALESGPYGGTSGLFWRTRKSRREIKAEFPDGKFPQTFLDNLAKEPEGLETLAQDIVADGDDWTLIVSLDKVADQPPIATFTAKTKPFVAARYWRQPGQVMGVGPALAAAPMARTLNKAQELALKAAAIQMLGIWGYRPGATFNPDTARLAPGQFWPVQSTGGVLGPDVARLDPPTARVDLSSFIQQELRTQLQQILHDERLPEGGATPRSASEIMARQARLKTDYVGAFGRMIAEIVPVVVARVIEVLYDQKLIVTQAPLDQLLVTVEAVSPLAAAIRVDRHQPTIQGLELSATLEGPQGMARRFDLDRAMPELLGDLGVPPAFLRDGAKLQAFDEQAQQAQEAAAVAQAALDKPKDFAEALAPPEDAAGAPPA